ncbi:putative transmembrane protein [Gregarina niphandrodes]|uniref:Transmembrane protein n=1 Tax=Gregarina niphandrodes TaxID=110365 RepID=A0A023B1L9_GRENI|nr:putative transmembrane protein [Gregarina niphandrodes]EZG46180.1 putative transmembrane protein [Gregarina niphandrodes]|eukprot:XP_011132341.1 putative transmembrane protein [Gregarina niphandrodes]
MIKATLQGPEGEALKKLLALGGLVCGGLLAMGELLMPRSVSDWPHVCLLAMAGMAVYGMTQSVEAELTIARRVPDVKNPIYKSAALFVCGLVPQCSYWFPLLGLLGGLLVQAVAAILFVQTYWAIEKNEGTSWIRDALNKPADYIDFQEQQQQRSFDEI